MNQVWSYRAGHQNIYSIIFYLAVVINVRNVSCQVSFACSVLRLKENGNSISVRVVAQRSHPLKETQALLTKKTSAFDHELLDIDPSFSQGCRLTVLNWKGWNQITSRGNSSPSKTSFPCKSSLQMATHVCQTFIKCDMLHGARPQKHRNLS